MTSIHRARTEAARLTEADARERLRGELIVAAFGEPGHALAAWQRWREGSGWQRHVDFESFLLLPRVYRNLGGQRVGDALYSRLRGVIRQNWTANTRRIALLRRLLSTAEADASGAVLPPPHALLCDDASAAFTAEQPRLWFSRRDAALSLARVLLRTGWRSHGHRVPLWCLAGYAAARHSLALEQAGNVLDLHWAGDVEGCQEGSAVVTTVTGTLAGTPVRCFGPPATVRHLLDGPGQGPPFRRVARALLYLERHGDPEAWACLQGFLDDSGAPWAEAAGDLVPGEAIGVRTGLALSTRALPDNPAASNRMPFLQKQRYHWRRYRAALGGHSGASEALAQLPGYLMGRWDLSRPAEIPARLLRGLCSDWRYRH